MEKDLSKPAIAHTVWGSSLDTGGCCDYRGRRGGDSGPLGAWLLSMDSLFSTLPFPLGRGRENERQGEMERGKVRPESTMMSLL